MTNEGNYRQRLIRLVTFLGGIYFFLEFLLPKSLLENIGVADYHSQISTGFIVVGTMAIGLGIINLFMVHGTRVAFRRKNWFYSIVLLSGLLLMMSITILDWMASQDIVQRGQSLSSLRSFSQSIVNDVAQNRQGVPAKSFRTKTLHTAALERVAVAKGEAKRLEESLFPDLSPIKQKLFQNTTEEFESLVTTIQNTELPELLQSDEGLLYFGSLLGEAGLSYQNILRFEYDASGIKQGWLLLYEGLYVSLGSAMFSLLGVYIAAAAYRAFRVKSFESSLMMIAATIVMLGQIPFYEYISMDLPYMRQWLLETPNSAAFRAIKIGAAIAGLIMAFRMWFSIESESFAKNEEKR